MPQTRKDRFLGFAPTTGTLSLNDILLIGRRDNWFRSRHITKFECFNTKIDKEDLAKHFQFIRQPGDPVNFGILTHKYKERFKIEAAQFQNLYMTKGAPETELGKFLAEHPEIIKRAFDVSEFESEVPLDWQSPSEGNGIRPDLFLKRENGYYDICDLKLALPDKRAARAASICR